jgi:MFS family permease
MNTFSGWSKILLFGAIGAVGCLIGALFGEVFLLWAKPAHDQGVTAGLMFNPELNARLQRAGAQSGDVQISLMWGNQNDLDLHVIDPNGEEIFFKHRRSRSGGELDVDMNADVRSGLTSQPVENVYWPSGGAPLGTYKIFVNHYRNHGAPDPTNFLVGVLVGGNVSVTGGGSGTNEISGQISFREPRQLVHEFGVQPPAEPRLGGDGYTALITGGWTALLAVGLALALAVGQNYYLRRPLFSTRRGAIIIGGLAAGLVAGGVGQMLFSLAAQFESVAQAGRAVGWLILGAILGRGMGFFIANLSGTRATIAGAFGGLLGALAYAWVSQIVGETGGRFLGAAILGFFIGVMVAIVEAVFREAWLDIAYGAKETRTVSLGVEPVSIGGDPNACTVYARNSPPVAFRYKLEQGRITCEDVTKGQTAAVQPGARQVIGNVTVTVRTSGAPTEAAPKLQAAARSTNGFSLRLSNGKTIWLGEGVTLSASDIPGLQAATGSGAVAEVARNPNDPALLGLKNHSRIAWTATLANRDRMQVEPGRSVRLQEGAKISFGSINGEIQK